MPAKVTVIRSKRKRAGRGPRRGVLQLLVVLLNTDPLVWRRILVPDSYSIWDLHVAIQDAMGWQDCHLHEFRIAHPQDGNVEYLGIPDPDLLDDRSRVADWDVRLSDYFNWETASVAPTASYVYDFGDGWHHLVTLEAAGAADSARLPRCVGGARACPPEDCGGVPGYEEFLDAIADPRHPEHAAMVEWSGHAYDPDAFDPTKVVFDDPRQRWTRAFEA
jgi:hypothetical protein